MQKLLTWIDDRFPLTALWESQWGKYVAPKNFNFWYYFGSLAAFVLVMQIVTGIFLTMSYKPDATKAFESVEYIMRDVSWGWLIRYMHSTGASMFFIVVYLHMFRGLMYGSYRKPRELTWIFGCLIYLCLMARGVLRLPAPVGPDVVLGRAGDRQPVLGGADHRRGPRRLDPRRLHDLRHHAQPLLRVPRDRDAARAARARRRAPDGAARDGLEQSGRRRDQEAAEGSRDGPAARRHLFAPVLHGEGHRRRRRASSRCSRSSCSSCRTWAATSSRRTTSSRPIR